jgi:hypothetical protein
MQKRFLVGFFCGIVFGVVGSIAVYRMTFRPSPILMQPVIQSEPFASPGLPPNAHRRQFNGSPYYIVPLSGIAQTN